MRLAVRVRAQKVQNLFDYLVSNFLGVNTYASVWDVGSRLQAVLELPLMQDVRILDCFAVKPSMIMLVSLSDGFSVVNSSPGGVYRDVLTLLAVELA
ncbi:hypothetical protein DYB28_015256 [Aphanomyces astaci]|uniref:Uncharacterized protein n=1 Tax=Aphanomyces astaci TaxID=112090 RepID=A0A9X8DRP3_APHAT|nr:hypothetical protein DYB28_015256 [Aphanomyces astaci]